MKIKKATKKFLSAQKKRPKQKSKPFKKKAAKVEDEEIVEENHVEEEQDLGFNLPPELESDDEMEMDEDEEFEDDQVEQDSDAEYELDESNEEYQEFRKPPQELINTVKRAKAGSFTALRKVWKELKEVAELESQNNEELIIYSSLAYIPNIKINVKQHQSSCKQFLNSCYALLKRRSELILKHFEHSVPILIPFKKLRKDVLKLLVSLWCNDSDHIRVRSFLVIRKMAMADTAILEESLKIMYNAMVQFKVNSYNYVVAQFMVNCMVELAGLSLTATYHHMFVSLRKLAIQLRQVTGGEDFAKIYNWQVLFAVRLWCRVITTFTDDDILKPLVYPLVQIMVGIIKHKPGVRYLPFRLSLIKLLIQITESTNTFIPITSYLLEIFTMAELKHSGKPSTLKPLDLTLNIKVPNQYLGTKSLQQTIIDETVHLLWLYFAVMSNSIAFPELTIPTIIHLKRFTKQGNVSKSLSQLIEKLEENSKYIETLRNKVQFVPKDLDKVQEFESGIDRKETPLGKFNVKRLKIQEKNPQNKAAFVEDSVKTKPTQKKRPSNSDSSSDGEDESTLPVPRNRTIKHFTGDEDLVEDFELSDDDE